MYVLLGRDETKVLDTFAVSDPMYQTYMTDEKTLKIVSGNPSKPDSRGEKPEMKLLGNRAARTNLTLHEDSHA
jgi:hypothetical protein